jgi:hypothetical protein
MVEETGPDSSEDYFHELVSDCAQDSFWTQDSIQPLDQPPRCQHCRHWVGQADLSQQLQHILNGCKTFSQQVLRTRGKSHLVKKHHFVSARWGNGLLLAQFLSQKLT